MQKVLTAAEMREVDRLTTERYGIPSIILMENAAHAVARVITEKLGGSVKGKSILILCGKGNNGGDGAALARILWKDGADVYVYVLGRCAETTGDARENFNIIEGLSRIDVDVGDAEVFFDEILCSDDWDGCLKRHFDHSDPDLIVDAMFGTGLTKPLSGHFETIARWARGQNIEGVEQDSLVLSVDLPSGLDANRPEWIGQSLRANWTVTFTAPKLSNILPPVHDFNGELHIANIGSPRELIDEQPSQLYLAERDDAAEWLRSSKFSSDSYKNIRGHALVIAGSGSYSGAAVLAANAAMRSGVGLVTLVTPKSSKVSVESRVLPEVMVRGAAETEGGAISEKAFDELGDLVSQADAVAIGSGMSQGTGVNDFVRRAVKEFRQPLILDADALNVLAPLGANWPPAYAGGSDIILTPHEGEFLRLLGTDDKDALKDRVSAVRDFSQKHNVILVLKGERVLIGEPGGRVVVNPTGNSGLGKAGNGDTLAGILAGFVAQAAKMNIDIFETVVAAVYVAGMAGDVAEKKFGKRVMTASDVRECLTDVFREFQIG
jgi:ADP-dependent NAD(P)H-hydrate dehydratase / NAD(P)H-hydrate epimerase